LVPGVLVLYPISIAMPAKRKNTSTKTTQKKTKHETTDGKEAAVLHQATLGDSVRAAALRTVTDAKRKIDKNTWYQSRHIKKPSKVQVVKWGDLSNVVQLPNSSLGDVVADGAVLKHIVNLKLRVHPITQIHIMHTGTHTFREKEMEKHTH
jgi:hypothetical protein